MPTIRIEGVVGADVTPQTVSEQLDGLSGEELTVELFSVGGNVYDGLEIYNRIAAYGGRKTVRLGGLVASIATYISTAFDRVVALPSTIYMIHNAQSFVIGDAEAMEQEAVVLRGHTQHIARRLAERSGKEVQEILDMMAAETWLYADEIVEQGFADEMGQLQQGQQPAPENRVVAFNSATQTIESEWQRVAQAYKMPRRRSSQGTEPDGGNGADSGDGEDNTDPNSGVAGDEQRGEATMKKDEVLQAVSTLRTNGDITLSEIATAMGVENQVLTQDHENALELVKRFNEAGVKDIDAEFKRLKEQAEAGEKAKRENELTEAFGPREETDEKSGQKVQNAVRLYAEQRYNGETTIEQIKADPVMQTLMAQRADHTSPQNNLGIVEPAAKDGQRADDGAPQTVTY